MFPPLKILMVVVVVVVVVCLIIVSTPGPDLSRFRLGLVRLVPRSTKARFGQVGDQLVRSRTRLVKARARSLTIIVVCQAKISVYVLFII